MQSNCTRKGKDHLMAWPILNKPICTKNLISASSDVIVSFGIHIGLITSSFLVAILQIIHQCTTTSSGCINFESTGQFNNLFYCVISDEMIQIDH